MSIISNYIFKQIGSYFIYITIFFISLIWLIFALKFIEYVTTNGLDFKDFIIMTSLLLPTIVPALTPITLSFACIWVYHKLSNDNELIIIKSSGFSSFKILKPAILLSLIIGIVNLFLNLYFSPLSKSMFKENQKNLREDIARIAFKEGRFSSLFQDITIYIEKIVDKNNYEYVFVYDNRNKKSPATYIAKEAELVQSDILNKVILKNGNRQIIDKKNSQLSIIKFDEYEVNLDALFKNNNEARIKEPEEMFLTELWDEKHKTSGRYDSRQILSMVVEGHKRIIDPLYCLIFTLISLTFLLSDKLVLQSTLKKTSIIIFAIFLIEVIYLSIPNFIVKEFKLLPIIYIFPISLLLFLAILNINKSYKGIKK
tara:strand:- start:782 stop:1891 length:1110 start_codon:yes stop_codon:yes gene_type:complete